MVVPVIRHARVLGSSSAIARRASGTTEIYVPESRLYPDGWDLIMSDTEGSWSSRWDATREVLSLTTPQTRASHVVRVARRAGVLTRCWRRP
ncbi:MAG: hypothetical protein U0610_30075 [bacterium]